MFFGGQSQGFLLVQVLRASIARQSTRGGDATAGHSVLPCHFNNWQRYRASPRLRGQARAYLTTTINEFRSNKRGNSPGMADLLGCTVRMTSKRS
jgi:cytochrome c553